MNDRPGMPEDRLLAAMRALKEFRAQEADGTAEPWSDFLAKHEFLRTELEDLGGENSASASSRPVVPIAKAAGDLVGDYCLLELLGAGGMGEVWLGKKDGDDTLFAIKLIRPDQVFLPNTIRRFKREAEFASRLRHDNICSVIDLGEDHGVPFIVMEYISGQTLHERVDLVRAEPDPPTLRATGGREDPFGIIAFTRIVEVVARAVHFAHENGLIHRDIKPQNIMINDDDRPIVLDFGCAREIDAESSLTHPNAMIGSPKYMAPEQVRNGGVVDPRTDVYALGTTLFYCLTGRTPFDGPTEEVLFYSIQFDEPPGVRALNKSVSRALSIVVAEALQKKPERRYRSALVFAEDLARVQNGLRPKARGASVFVRSSRWCARYPWAAAMLVVLSVAFGLVSVLATQLNSAIADLEPYSVQVGIDELLSKEAQLYSLSEADPLVGAWLETAAQLIKSKTHWKNRRKYLEVRAYRVRDSITQDPTVRQLRRSLDNLRIAAKQREQGGNRIPDTQGADVEGSYDSLCKEAWECAHNYGTSVTPSVLLGLKKARAALQTEEAINDDKSKAAALEILAWSLLAAGHDHEASQAMVDCIHCAPEDRKPAYRTKMARLDHAIRNVDSESSHMSISRLERELAKRIEALSRQALRFGNPADALAHRAIHRVVAGLESLDHPDGAIARILKRAEWGTLYQGYLEKHQDRWSHAIKSIRESDRYGHLVLAHQAGLIPLGMNPQSGLWEFYHFASASNPSGPIPTHDTDGKITVDGSSGIVFVLVPAGTFMMGSNPDPNNPLENPDERPVCKVPLDAFFLAKHELTQGQWMRLTNDDEPSGIGFKWRWYPITPAHPVEDVSWTRCREVLTWHGLVLPTEAQWEYACRAGTEGPWWTGAELSSLGPPMISTNLSDQHAKEDGNGWGSVSWDDGWTTHAPVDAYPTNPWGFVNMMGNVLEWCLDAFVDYDRCQPRDSDGLRTVFPEPPDRIVRGGAYNLMPKYCRSSRRSIRTLNDRDSNLGLRAARAVQN